MVRLLLSTALAIVIGQLFFPAEDPVSALLSGFAVLAIGYLARPLGGASSLLGGRADRKRAVNPALGLRETTGEPLR